MTCHFQAHTEGAEPQQLPARDWISGLARYVDPETIGFLLSAGVRITTPVGTYWVEPLAEDFQP